MQHQPQLLTHLWLQICRGTKSVVNKTNKTSDSVNDWNDPNKMQVGRAKLKNRNWCGNGHILFQIVNHMLNDWNDHPNHPPPHIKTTKKHFMTEMTQIKTLYLPIPSPTSILIKLPIVTWQPTFFDKSFSTVWKDWYQNIKLLEKNFRAFSHKNGKKKKEEKNLTQGDKTYQKCCNNDREKVLKAGFPETYWKQIT